MKFFAENYQDNESGNWNNAQRYSNDKIMTILTRIDEYQRIATLGYSDLFEQFISETQINFNDNLDEVKLKAFVHLVNELILLCDNAEFAIEKDKQDFDKIKAYLNDIRDKAIKTPFLYKNITKKDKKTIKLTENYPKLLKLIQSLKCQLNTPLNKNNLIFNPKEKISVKDIKQKYMDDLINRG